MKIETIFGVLILVIFFSALIPTIIENIQGTSIIRLYDGNLTLGEHGWNFTGASGAVTLFLVIPFIIIAAFALGLVLNLIGKSTSGVG